jgi:hypothetical protein
MEFQLNLEKLKIEKGQTPSKVSDSNAKYKGPKVPKFEEGQDIDSSTLLSSLTCGLKVIYAVSSSFE